MTVAAAGVGEILLDIAVVLVAAKLAAELAERVRIPAVVGEMLAGVLVGPSVLGWVAPTEVLEVLGEVGVVLLLLQVGLEMNVGELRAVGSSSLRVALIGVILPMAAGVAVAASFGHDGDTALFLGAALAATSFGITARVFSDLRALASSEARTVLGAAVADDVMGLVILTVVVRVVTEGSVSAVSVAGIVLLAVGFLVVAAAVGTRLAPPLFQWVQRSTRSAGTLVAIAFAFTLVVAELASVAQLAPIVGAFVAGLVLSDSAPRERIERDLQPIGHVFIPVFFVLIGIQVDVASFVDGSVLALAAALFGVAVVGKLAASLGAARNAGDRWTIGFGMVPRGEVGLVFATIGLQEGVLGDDLYGSLVLVVLGTTLLAPPLLRARVTARAGSRSPGAGDARPDGGWLRLDDGIIDLAATPPVHTALDVGLEAATAIAGGSRPGPRLLDWLGALGATTLRWGPSATDRLFDVLRFGNERAWRFLEATGLLPRALPELSEAFRRRRADPYVVDPSQVLQFRLVDEVRAVSANDEVAAREAAQLAHPEWLLLAALILETAGEDAAPVELARRLVKRLDLGAAAEEEIALLVGSSGLLRAAALRIDGLDEESVLQVATHLERPERARALYLLSLGLGDLDAVERERLDELLALVLAVLEQPSLTSLDARNLVEQRRAEAVRIVGEASSAADRIRHAPRAYLLAHEAREVARQAELIEPLPGRAHARVAVDALASGNGRAPEWRVEVASRDRPGLLATVSGVLADHDLDVLDATVATWGDGGALESFRVRRRPRDLPAGRDEAEGTAAPDAEALARAITAAFGRPLASPPNPDAEVLFDDAASPWYTLCEVRSPDRRGLLHTITVALASAGASVHSARLLTVDGRAVDRFELTDATGRKLDRTIKDAIRKAVVDGVPAKRRRRRPFATPDPA